MFRENRAEGWASLVGALFVLLGLWRASFVPESGGPPPAGGCFAFAFGLRV